MSKKNDCCCCNRSSSGNGLLILILIVLQFNCCRERRDHECGGSCVDNGILFIIALYFVACCGNFNLCGNGCGCGCGC